MIWYVDCKVKVNGDGSKDHPFMHIQDAANVRWQEMKSW